MARQLIPFACLVAVVFSSFNCYFAGKSVGGKCQTNSAIAGNCYTCTEGQLPSTCYEVGPTFAYKCPSDDLVIKDPFGTGVCVRCPLGGR